MDYCAVNVRQVHCLPRVMLALGNKIYQDLRQPEFMYRPGVGVKYPTSAQIHCGGALGAEFGDGYAGDFSFSFWWYPTIWTNTGIDYSIFSWGTTLGMAVLGSKIIITIKDDEVTSNSATLQYIPDVPTYGALAADFAQWQLVVCTFKINSPHNIFTAKVINDTTINGPADGAFTFSGNIPTIGNGGSVGFNCNANELILGEDGPKPFSNSYISGFSFWDSDLTNTAISYLHSGANFKQKQFIPSVATHSSGSYGGSDFELYSYNHKCHLLYESKPSSLGQPTDTQIYDSIDRYHPYDLSGESANIWRDKASIPSNTNGDLAKGSAIANGDTATNRTWYEIKKQGTTNFTLSGAPDNKPGTKFFLHNAGFVTLGPGDSLQPLSIVWSTYGDNNMGIQTIGGQDYFNIEYIDDALGASIRLGHQDEFFYSIDARRWYRIELSAYCDRTSDIVVSDANGTQSFDLTTTETRYTIYAYSGTGNIQISFDNMTPTDNVRIRSFNLVRLPYSTGVIKDYPDELIDIQDSDMQTILLGATY